MHTNSFDEALALPSDFSSRIARNTQLFLQQEADTCRVIDPWAGSYYVERLTGDLAARAWEHITEIEETGGMTRAIEAGIPKLRIEEAAARTQARIDSGRQAVIGVNRYRLEVEDRLEVLRVSTAQVRRGQVIKLTELRAQRDEKICREAGILPNIQMALDSIESTKRMIERGLGISFLPLNALSREIQLGTISQIPLEGDYRITLPTGVMVRKVTSYGAIVTAFLDLLNNLYLRTTPTPASA